ncbi:sensor histidine kinase [soil metagenome]
MKLPKLARVDVLMSLLAIGLLQAEVWVFDPGPPAVVRSVLALVAAGALAFMQPFPIGSFLFNGFAIYGLIGIGSPSDLYQWTNLLSLVLMAARTSLRRGLIPLFLGLLGVGFYFTRFPEEGGIVTMLAVQILYVAGFLGGTSQRSRLRSERLENERDLAEARLAATTAKSELEAERTRIARELHDVVGHALTVMVVQAGAGESVLDGDPATTRKALQTIAHQGREALKDMDRMLNVLHGDSPRTRLPQLEDLNELVTGVAGPSVTLDIEGDPAKVPTSVSLAGFRIVQEALTNALRHSQAKQVEVHVAIDHELKVSVVDDGVGGSPKPGRGLLGMVERAELHGGTVRFGPGSSGGFEIRARIPMP